MQQQERKITTILKRMFWLLGIVFMFVIFIATLPYAVFTNIYVFPEPKPFSGQSWHNPYAGLNLEDDAVWKKSNFHGHTKAWEGMTDGHSGHEIFDSVYRSLGYYAVGISNYQFIDTVFKHASGYVPCYEHGYNLWKRHHVCIGAKSVTWLDFIFGQSIHHKQTMLDNLRPTVDVLGIAHPKFRGSFDPEDFAKLSGYDCIEVLNHYRISEAQWDSALSAGHPAWILGDDDTHNALAEGETGVCWTMIHAPGSPASDKLTTSLKQGKAFGITGKRGRMEFYPKRYEIAGDSILNINLNGMAKSIVLIGQGGRILRRDSLTSTLSYRLRKEDTYVRAMIYGDSSIIWMNPVMRGNGIRNMKPTIDEAKTIAYRGMWWTAYGLIFIVYFAVRKKLRR